MSKRLRPLNVSFRKGSPAEEIYRSCAGLPIAEVIAPGVEPTPSHDLLFHGGRTIQDLHFRNFYIGAGAWSKSDMQNIDQSLAAAMSDTNLNNVMEQYFSGSITSTFEGSTALSGSAPKVFSQDDVEALVRNLEGQGTLSTVNLKATVFNFLLPPGTILNDNSTSGGERERGSAPRGKKSARKKGVVPEDERADSLNGLGGYHGSVHAPDGSTVYYAISVYSQILPDGRENGIVAFNAPWKNVVATLYHELNEARTDADVEDAIRAGNDPNAVKFLGWMSKQGEECGDFPVFEVGADLSKVFQEVSLTGGMGIVPVQFQYSNAVHGPEGPVPAPEKKAKTTTA
jgi:hypothetical protein